MAIRQRLLLGDLVLQGGHKAQLLGVQIPLLMTRAQQVESTVLQKLFDGTELQLLLDEDQG